MNKKTVILITCFILLLISYLSVDKGYRHFYINKLINGNSIHYENIELELSADYAVKLFRKNMYLLINIDDVSKEFFLSKYSDLEFTVENAVQKSAFKKLVKIDDKCLIYKNIFETDELISYFILYRDLDVVVEFADAKLANHKLLEMCTNVFKVKG
jgi:hypothetical protein